MSKQITIKESVMLDGVNIYNNCRSHVTFHPAEENSGLIFRVNGNEIKASLEYAFNKKKAICLDDGSMMVLLVEHLLSPVYALGIDNLVIELSDNVCPALDNCAKEYFSALKDLRKEQPAEKKYWSYNENLELTIRSFEKRKPDCLTVKKADKFVIDYFAYYPHKTVLEQQHRLEFSEDDYGKNIMEARSIAFMPNGLFKKAFLFMGRLGLHGINEKNYLIIPSKRSKNYANPKEFGVRYGGQEFVRHKILDVLGTLALTGRQFKDTEFRFHMTGHRFDLYALKMLFNEGNFSEK